MKEAFLTRAFFAAICIAMVACASTALAAKSNARISKEGQACIACHEMQSPAFVKEWSISKHATKGVDC